MVSSISMVTVWPEWRKPTVTRWPITWIPPRLETRRWTRTGVSVRVGGGPASRAPRSLARSVGGRLNGMVRHSVPSAMTWTSCGLLGRLRNLV
jgi:hypothetical protein